MGSSLAILSAREDVSCRLPSGKSIVPDFEAADVDAILAAAGVTKGALYYHFASKEVLGYAVVDEVVASITREKWLQRLRSAK
jgi:Bacterial regulatory proteins, tetR family